MPHYLKPFFRALRGLWYVQLDGRQLNFGPDREKAFRHYHALMDRPRDDPRPVADDSAVAVLDAFLDWCQRHRAPRTYDWYRDYLESFARSLPRGLAVAEFRPIHVQRWVDSEPGWKTCRRGAIVAVQRAFNWAARMGVVAANPVRHVEKSRAGWRDVVIGREEYAWILGRVKDGEFRDLLTVCWETGCRPQEALAVEARHVDLGGGRWVFPPDEAKGKTAHRVVYLTDIALEVTRRLVARWPEGPIIRNTDGRPWHPYPLNCRFGRLRVMRGRERIEALGLVPPNLRRLTATGRRKPTIRATHEEAVRNRRETIEDLARVHGKRWCLYNSRHSFATRLLEAGVDALTVSTLIGHANGTMLARVYSHLAKKDSYLHEALHGTGRSPSR